MFDTDFQTAQHSTSESSAQTSFLYWAKQIPETSINISILPTKKKSYTPSKLYKRWRRSCNQMKND